ncbi:hypothetical protein [Micromonospora sp. NPDC005806]|uniref:hypothetical protein n=1 Tax=Micromonospora sp. NPDC005806 TaxID=3364234 RepID=UPI0036AA9EB9
MRRRIAATLATLTLGTAAALLPSSPAFAANDSFWAYTTDHCGAIEFVDSGTYSDGSTNDDFFKIHDYCTDGHGVRATVVFDYESTYTKYNGLGYAGPPVYWDPWTNVLTGENISMEVCLVDGASDTTGAKCGWADHTSIDG